MVAFLVMICYVNLSFADPVAITRVRASHNDKQTRLVFDFTGPIPAIKVFTLDDPERVVLDIPNAHFAALPTRALLKNTIVDDIRSGRKQSHLRVVIDLSQDAKPATFTLAPQYPYGYRLVLDLNLTGNTKKMTPKPAGKQAPQPVAPVILVNKHEPQHDIIVVIDPGHGGKDPGASGPNNIHEKNIVLAISRALQQKINSYPGFKAVLTRSSDYYLSLRQRLHVARRDKADMFVAVHADAYRNPLSNGASVYALSERGASSEAARWLAEKENYSELGGVTLGDKSDILRSVLIDLSQTATINESLKVGHNVLNQLDDITRLHHNKVEQARFVVLKSPDIPSILVETGFISNPQEARRLENPSYQRKIADALATGIKQYFLTHPPHGATLFTQKQKSLHIVKKGEYLALLAKQYHVKLPALKKLNNIKNNNIHIGQKLLIPNS